MMRSLRVGWVQLGLLLSNIGGYMNELRLRSNERDFDDMKTLLRKA